ncbi:methyltransferase domain-containing protein [Candidatus Bathyarchaeota archaeon]|nr:methyltransferase domain-containing protein [Candidatus Bathyarchaeota archaeon]
MVEITHEDYKRFIENRREVIIENVKVKLYGEWNISSFSPPDEYLLERETVWSFPDRGGWATHMGDYRGNWSPYIPRNLILKYTLRGDLVLDQMVGSGTTLVECKLLGRNAVGVDVNIDAVMVARDRLNFRYNQSDRGLVEPIIKTYVGDARNLDKIDDESIDLIATHPPYAKMIPYTKSKVEGDLSNLPLPQYLEEMRRVADESMRVLKKGKYCAVLIGDTRKRRHYVPISFMVMQQFLDAGFILKEDIIKRQWKTKTTRERWRGKDYDFYLIAHEHLFVFRKPGEDEELKKFKYSVKWW